MKIALRIVGVLAALGAAVVIVGWLLPVSHVAERTKRFAHPPEIVYGVVSDVANYPVWWPELQRIEMLPPVHGRVRFRQHTSDGTLLMEIDEARAPSRFVTRIVDPDQPFGGTWTFEIAPSDGGARVRLTERGEVYNPVFRFVSRFILGHASTIESFLGALERRLG